MTMGPAEKERPLVSVICLAYNHEKYIRDALNGFVKQKTDFPFEVVIHDDASTDKTADIIREYEKRYPHIIKPILQHENQKSKGSGIVTRLTYEKAQGKYIALCEGDDYWTDPLKLQMQVDFLEKNEAFGLIYTASRFYDQTREVFIPEVNKGRYSGDVFEKILTGKMNIITASTMFRSSFIAGFMKEIEPVSKEPCGMDTPLWLYISKHSKIQYFDKETVVYRVLGESASHSKDIRKISNTAAAAYRVRRFFMDKYTVGEEIRLQVETAWNEKLLRLYSSTGQSTEAKQAYMVLRKHRLGFGMRRIVLLILSYVPVLWKVWDGIKFFSKKGHSLTEKDI